MGAMSSNRRKHTRVRARGLAAHLRMPAGRVACQVENISLGGIFVRTDKLEEVGTEIFVDVVRPGWKKQLTMAAKITSRVDAIEGRISKRMPGMGLQFVHLVERQHERLLALLRELGAPEEENEVTLPDDLTETELRALDIDLSSPAAPLDPGAQPLWRQVEMVEDESARLQSVQAAIDGALEGADLAPPGPVALDDDEIPAGPPDDARRLLLQVRGLVMQLSDAQQQLAQRDAEIERLREELETTRAALQRALRH